MKKPEETLLNVSCVCMCVCVYALTYSLFLQDLLDNTLIGAATDDDSKVFYHKMKGDYHRYLCEVETDDDRESKYL